MIKSVTNIFTEIRNMHKDGKNVLYTHYIRATSNTESKVLPMSQNYTHNKIFTLKSEFLN